MRPITWFFIGGFGFVVFFYTSVAKTPAENANSSAVYVGSDTCALCHEKEFSNFTKYAKKASSWENIAKMRTKLTPAEFQECFECHTTGYGKPGGFISEKETPHLKEPGCEVCHGPGSIHSESENKKDIGYSLDAKSCESCHDENRVKAFNFKPLIHGGAH